MLDKHLHIKVDQETHDWLKESAHKYKKSIGAFTRRVIEVEMIEDLSYQENKNKYEHSSR